MLLHFLLHDPADRLFTSASTGTAVVGILWSLLCRLQNLFTKYLLVKHSDLYICKLVSQIYLERAQQGFIDAHHCTGIVEFAAIVRSRE